MDTDIRQPLNLHHNFKLALYTRYAPAATATASLRHPQFVVFVQPYVNHVLVGTYLRSLSALVQRDFLQVCSTGLALAGGVYGNAYVSKNSTHGEVRNSLTTHASSVCKSFCNRESNLRRIERSKALIQKHGNVQHAIVFTGRLIFKTAASVTGVTNFLKCML